MASVSEMAADPPGALMGHTTPHTRQDSARGTRGGARGGQGRYGQAGGPPSGRRGGRPGREGAIRGYSGNATNGVGSARIPPPATSKNQISLVTDPATIVPRSDGEAEESTAVDGEASAVEELEAELCFICASPVVHNSLAPCNHRTCHICALRLRALYKTKACAHCRVSLNTTA